MKPTLTLLLALAAVPARAETPLLGEMSRLMNLFDSGGAMPYLDAPSRAAARRGAPVDAEQWAPAVTESAPAEPGAPRDAFDGLEECAAADAVYVRQPSLAEAAAALAPCLDAVSRRYGASVVGAAEEKSMLIRLPAAAAEAALARDLRFALKKRKGSLFGWPVSVRADIASMAPKGTSVLQPVLDRCPTAKMLPADAEGFVSVYGDCLRSAKGLGIAEVKAHPTEAGTVVVYSGGRVETLLDMSGVVRVPSAPGTGPFRIEARRSLAAGLLRRG